MTDPKYDYKPVSIQPVATKMIDELLESDPIKYQSKSHVVTIAVKELHDRETKRNAKLVEKSA